MLITNYQKINCVLEPLIDTDVKPSDYTFIIIKKEGIGRPSILLFEDGDLFCSTEFRTTDFDTLEKKFTETSIKIVTDLGIDSNKYHIFFLRDNDSIILVAYIDKKTGRVSIPDYSHHKGIIRYSLFPPDSKESAIIMRKSDNKLFYLVSGNANTFTTTRLLLLIANTGKILRRTKTINTTGTSLLINLLAKKYSYDDFTDFQPTAVFKLVGNSDFGISINYSLNTKELLSVLESKIKLNVPESSGELKLSDLLNNPKIIENTKEVTDVVLDISLDPQIATYGKIQQMYIEDFILYIKIFLYTRALSEKRSLEYITNKMEEVMSTDKIVIYTDDTYPEYENFCGE